jgi:hypothetical protein
MNRRQMVVLPAVALAASRGFAETQGAVVSTTGSVTNSHKAIAHYSRPKSYYTIPKNARKQAKYISFLTTVLSLAPNQQADAASIFASASTSDAALKKQIKVIRQSLGESVRANDSAGMSKTAVAIGNLVSQRHVIGANANAAVFQLLTADQQAKLNQIRS